MKERESEVASIMINMFDVEKELEIFIKTENREAERKGEAKGRAEGEARGKYEKALSVATKMLRKNKYDFDEIADCSGLSIDEVVALANGKSLQFV